MLSDAVAGGDSVSTESQLAPADSDTPTPVTSLLPTCPSCQSTFDRMSSLVAHVTLSHGRCSTVRRRVGSLSSQRPFRCFRCWKTFPLESKLRLHMLSHAENLKDFKCDVRTDDLVCTINSQFYKIKGYFQFKEIRNINNII